ncbi:MAG TPA: 4-hydroxy-tetrahydrodipicolinate reductase [Dehalococcoidia bacterium]|nr:4-hydroxy-tetrahydrodipicolinate reductase [Dehalococcoidia bacterium]
MIRVLVSGSGKMGRTIIDALDAEADLQPVGVVDGLAAPGEWRLPSGGAVPLLTDAAAACDETKPDIVIDFTNAAWTPQLVAAALPRGVRPVIGTTGLSQSFVEGLRRECRERGVGGVIAANFALGAVLLMRMAKLAAPFFEAAEIIELHHDQKVDAPSGTAIATARMMIEGRGGKPFARNEPSAEPVAGARAASVDGITLHSVRLPGYVAHQEVLFGGLGQTLTIRHDTTGRDSFMPGVMLAARAVMGQRELVVGLDALIDVEP